MARKPGSLILPACSVIASRWAHCGVGRFVYSAHATNEAFLSYFPHLRMLLHSSSGNRAPERKSGAFKRAVQIPREEEEESNHAKDKALYHPLQDDTRFDKQQQQEEEEFMSIPFLRPDLAISSARRRPKRVVDQKLPPETSQHGEDLDVTLTGSPQSTTHFASVAVQNPSQQEFSALSAREREAEELQENQDIRSLIGNEIKSARLFRHEEVEGPLTGSLLPIRPRKHKWTPMHLVAADRDEFVTRNVESIRPNTLKVWWERLLNSYYWFTPESGRQWLARKHTRDLVKLQKLNPARLREIGAELCTADIVFGLGGRVKFYGVDRWYNALDAGLMPSRFSEQISLEAVDLSNTEITYDGLENFVGLKSLRWLSLQNCQRVTDFCMPRLFTVHRTLEFLDLSGCKMITDRGLGWLHHME